MSKDSMFIEPKPKTKEELIQRVLEAWNSFTPDLLKKLSQSFKKRIVELEKSRH